MQAKKIFFYPLPFFVKNTLLLLNPDISQTAIHEMQITH